MNCDSDVEDFRLFSENDFALFSHTSTNILFYCLVFVFTNTSDFHRLYTFVSDSWSFYFNFMFTLA